MPRANLQVYQPKALFIKEEVVVEAGWPANKSELELGLSKPRPIRKTHADGFKLNERKL
jgi:hypothetical protein